MYSMAFKKEVLQHMEEYSLNVHQTWKYFCLKDNFNYEQSMFYQWKRNATAIMKAAPTKKRIPSGGRKPALGILEDIIADEIVELRIQKLKVTRDYIRDRARELAFESGIELDAGNSWCTKFLKRNGFSLRRVTNLTTLDDDTLVSRAVGYCKFLQSCLPDIDLSKTLLADETAVYFKDSKRTTVNETGKRHVVFRSTGFSSMRVTVLLSMWADGKKGTPLVIHKGKKNQFEFWNSHHVNFVNQEKGWVNSELLKGWINIMFPRLDTSPGMCIIWDSCRAHVSKEVKAHLENRGIKLITIPGGLTSYLQAGDIGVFKVFKDNLNVFIDDWKESDEVQYTAKRNPKPPSHDTVHMWTDEAWKKIPRELIETCILAAGFDIDYKKWFIARNHVYGAKFRQKWTEDTGIVDLTDTEDEMTPDDELDNVSDDENWEVVINDNDIPHVEKEGTTVMDNEDEDLSG
jgi:hypothetical protein